MTLQPLRFHLLLALVSMDLATILIATHSPAIARVCILNSILQGTYPLLSVADPFVEEVDTLLQSELEERNRRTTASNYKAKRSSTKRNSTVVLASQLLDWY